MSWSDMKRFARVFGALALAGLTAGCFQPLYGERTTTTGSAGLPAQVERGRRRADRRARRQPADPRHRRRPQRTDL